MVKGCEPGWIWGYLSEAKGERVVVYKGFKVSGVWRISVQGIWCRCMIKGPCLFMAGSK